MTPRLFALLFIQGAFTGWVCYWRGHKAGRKEGQAAARDLMDLILTDPLWTEEKIEEFREASK